MRPIILAMALLALPAAADYSIYVDGKKVADCPVASSSAVTQTAADGYGKLLFGHTGNGDAQPINGEPLYDQIVIQPGLVFFEVAVKGIHHMVWLDNGAVIRRENYWPYTTRYNLTAGKHKIEARIYSSESVISATYTVDVYVADGGAAVDPAPSGKQVVVEWTEPTARENGEPLKIGDLAEYILEVGSDTIKIPAPASRHTLWLPSGTYLIALSVVDTAGLQSEKSDPIEITL